MSEAPIPWPHRRCIVCLEDRRLTLEHVIPRALGGILACAFLCKPCNDFFGSGIDANAKTDPAIRMAALRIRGSAPDLIDRIEEGQKYLIKTLPATLSAVKRDAAFAGRWTKLSDGSLLAPEEQSIPALRGMLASDGLKRDEIDEAIVRWIEASFDTPTVLSKSITVVKRTAELVGPDLSHAQLASDLLFVKVAYEFAALLVGGAIYRDVPTFREIRRVLKEDDPSVFKVERLEGESARAFHGIAFESNDPYAKFQIRLFGRPAFRVHLIGLALDIEPIAYTHDLVTNTHWHDLPDPKAA